MLSAWLTKTFPSFLPSGCIMCMRGGGGGGGGGGGWGVGEGRAGRGD